MTIILNNNKTFLLSIILFFSQMAFSQTPIAGITSNPAMVLGTISVCSGNTVIFNSSSTQTTAQSSYTWNFGIGAIPQTATGIGPHAVVYTIASTTTTSVTLTVDNVNGQATSTATRSVTINYIANPNLLLTSSGSGFTSGTTNGLALFKKCDSSGPALFSFQSNFGSATSQTFNWGDGTSSNQANMAGNQITHVYTVGQFTITHAVTIGSCTKITQYVVFNGSSPVVSVTGSGQTTCLPSPYSIAIASNDVPINYVVSFSDGSQVSTFSSSNDTIVSHIFNSSSCGIDYVYAPGIPPIENAFSVSVLAQNFCSNGFPTVFTIGPITVSTGPDASFTYSPNSPICQGEAVSFENTSGSGENISENGCDSTYSFYWQVLQSGGFVLNSGTFGTPNGFTGSSYDFTQWTTGSNNLDITFNTPGSYDVVLFTGNSCGVDSIVQTLVIKPTATVSFSPTNQTICSGDATNSITMTSTVPGYIITWEITDTSNVQGVVTMTGSGVSPLVFNPITVFNNGTIPGTIEISATVGCTSVPPTIHTVTVNPEGTISADPLTSLICSGETTSIALESNLSAATFTWTVVAPNTIIGEANGAGIGINQVLTNNGNSIQTAVYTVSIGNVACPGPDVIVTVAVQPLITINQNADITVCPGEQINPDNYISTPAGASISWSNSNTSVGIGNSGTGDLPTWIAPQNTTGININATITVSAQLNNCPGVEEVFEITINPSPIFTYSISPSTGLSCTTNTATIVGTANPANCSVNWTGPSILSGSNTLVPVVNAPGTYTITLTENTSGCATTASVQIDPPTQVSITQVSINPVSCFGGNNGSISVQTNNSGDLEYDWSPAVSSNQTANNLTTGNYSITVTNEDGCTDDTTVFVSQATPIDFTVADSIGSECEEANGSILVVASGGQGGYSFNWSNGQSGSLLSEVDAGNYSLSITDNAGCVISGTVSLGCTPLIPLITPQFLSPNNDGKNDVWIIQNIDFYPDNKVTVYNRWGNIVFEAEPYTNDWNGHYKGKAGDSLPASTYFYVVDTKKKSQDPFTGYIEIQP